jgi:hypothetical protein
MTGGQVIEVANYDRWPGYRGGQLYSFQYIIKCSQATSRVSTLRTRTEMVLETSVYFIHLTWLIAREDFIVLTVRCHFSSDMRHCVFYLFRTSSA